MSNDKKTIKGMRANDMTPAFPTHPGDVLKDEIEYRGISQRQLAEEMGIAYSALPQGLYFAGSENCHATNERWSGPIIERSE